MRSASTILPVVLFATIGCSSKLPRTVQVSGHGEMIASRGSGGKAPTGPTQIELTEGKTALRATLETEHSGNRLTHRVFMEKEPYETEVYEDTADEFRLLQMLDESFSPPLPLCKFPLKLGDAWGWNGKVTYAGVARNAVAQLNTHPQRENDCMVIEAKVSIDAGPGKPVVRSLILKVARSGGIVERDYAPFSKRKASPL